MSTKTVSGLMIAIAVLLGVATAALAGTIPYDRDALIAQNFDRMSTGVPHWTQEAMSGSGTWRITDGTDYDPFYPANSLNHALCFPSGDLPAGTATRICWPADTFSTVGYQGMRVSFYFCHSGYSDADDSLRVVYRVSGGPWNPAAPAIPRYNGAGGPSWVQYHVDIPSIDNKGDVAIAFEGTGDAGDNLYLDDISVNGYVIPPSLSTEDMALGTMIRITGDHFGDAKGKVALLLNDPDAQAVNTKVFSWTDEEIVCFVTKLPTLGDYHLRIIRKTPKGGPVIVHNYVTAQSPQIDDVLSNTGSPGDAVNLAATYHGSKRGRVYLVPSGAAEPLIPAKISGWGLDASTGQGGIVFVIPAGVAPGLYSIRVDNTLGTVTAVDALTVN